MKEQEQILHESILSSLQNYGLQESRATSIANKAVERARRVKHSGPFTRPGVLISDEISSKGYITITIRKEYLDEGADPHKILEEYLERENIPGVWALKEAHGYPNPRVRVWRAGTTKEAKKAKKVEKDILKDFNKLDSVERQKILAALQNNPI